MELSPSGTPPSARRGHSLIWDGNDLLIGFGGTTGSAVDAGVFVYCISRNEWSTPHVTGPCPLPRTQHSAVMVSPTQMLVFGGCSAAGVFFNDTYILDILSWAWSKPQVLNAAPPPRYHHSMVMTECGKVRQKGGGALLARGSNGCFDGSQCFGWRHEHSLH